MGRKLLAVISILLTIAIFMPFANATSGRCIDIFTRRGGKGPGEPGGAFRPFELVQVYANVTYNEWPVQNVLVAFGAPTQGLYDIARNAGFFLEEIVDFVVNTVPKQGTETVRTEEAIFASLAILNMHFSFNV